MIGEPRIFFSVVIPLRNVEKWVGACLDSLLSQTFPSWNCWICDDASTDSTWEIIDAKVGRDPRFHFIRNKERFTALPNLMRMCREATGDHIIILDGDDAFLRPDALDIIFAVYNDAPSVIATSGQYVRWPDGGVGHCRGEWLGMWFGQWPFGHPLTFCRDICVEMMDLLPCAYLDYETNKPYTTTYDLALYFPVVAWADWNEKRVAHISIPTYLYRRWESNDDSTRQGLADQSLCARKIQLFWYNEMAKHDLNLGAK